MENYINIDLEKGLEILFPPCGYCGLLYEDDDIKVENRWSGSGFEIASKHKHITWNLNKVASGKFGIYSGWFYFPRSWLFDLVKSKQDKINEAINPFWEAYNEKIRVENNKQLVEKLIK